MDQETSIAQVIRARLVDTPGTVRMRYLARGEEETAALTCAEIDEAGCRVASGLLASGLAGKRILLVMETGPDFLAALLGCFYSGAVAVPAPEPRPGASLDRLQGIVFACRPAAILASAKVASQLREQLAEGGPLAALPLLEVGELLKEIPLANGPGLSADPSTPVVIQYTSGSTGRARGVILDSACILANLDSAARAAAVALPLAAAAALNLAMDPYSAESGQWYRLRGPLHDDVADRAPDAGTAARMTRSPVPGPRSSFSAPRECKWASRPIRRKPSTPARRARAWRTICVSPKRRPADRLHRDST